MRPVEPKAGEVYQLTKKALGCFLPKMDGMYLPGHRLEEDFESGIPFMFLEAGKWKNGTDLDFWVILSDRVGILTIEQDVEIEKITVHS